MLPSSGLPSTPSVWYCHPKIRMDVHMSGNTLTIVSTAAGIVVGFLTSWWFTRSGRRDAQAEEARLLKEISTLQEKVSTQQGLLSGIAESAPRIEQALQSARLSDQAASAVATSRKSATSAPALDVLVRASLGALLNEHGEVSVPRLLRAVTRGLPDASSSSIASSLEELRKAGKVSWSGDDVIKAGVVRVHPQ